MVKNAHAYGPLLIKTNYFVTCYLGECALPSTFTYLPTCLPACLGRECRLSSFCQTIIPKNLIEENPFKTEASLRADCINEHFKDTCIDSVSVPFGGMKFSAKISENGA